MNYEYRTKDWEMWVEGTSDNKPSENELINDAKNNGYKLNDIEIWFDDVFGVWRFSAYLIKG